MKKLIVLLMASLFLTSCSADNNVKPATESAVSATATSLTSIALESDELPKQHELVVWQDKALEKLVRNKLSKPMGDIFTDKLKTQGFTHLCNSCIILRNKFIYTWSIDYNFLRSNIS